MSSQEWNDMKERWEHRFIRTLDVASIPLFDAIPVGVGFFVISGLDKMAEFFGNSSNPGFYLKALETVAHGSFILLFLAWVIIDSIDLIKHQIRGR